MSQRIIKFRAWDKVEKKMVYEVTPYQDKNRSECWVYIGSTGEHAYIDEFEIMQFTGLLDKNGKEIWEGDIVGWPWSQGYTKREVIYTAPAFHLKGFHPNFFHSMVSATIESGVVPEYEVLGNIYENPELLTSTTKKENHQ